jgi:mono/diheme cytochrome c family protein
MNQVGRSGDVHNDPRTENRPCREGEHTMFRMFAVGLTGALAVLSATAWSQELGSAQRGQRVAETICAECHAIQKGATRSVNANAPAFQTLAKTPGMTEMAFRVWLRSSHKEMPNIMLENEEVDDVIAYIQSLK